MAYLLPRATIVLIAWGLTCGPIRKFWPDAEPVVLFVAGASWTGAGITYFAYLHRLKRDIDDLTGGATATGIASVEPRAPCPPVRANA